MINIKGFLQVKPTVQPPGQGRPRPEQTPPLRLGQVLEASVVRVEPDLVLLDLGGRQLEAETSLPLERGQKLSVEVLSVEPRLTLQRVEDTEARALVRSLANLAPEWKLGDMLKILSGTSEDAQRLLLDPKTATGLEEWAGALVSAAKQGRTTNLEPLLDRLARSLESVPGAPESPPSEELVSALRSLVDAARPSEGQGFQRLAEALARVLESTESAEPVPSSSAKASLAPLKIPVETFLQDARKGQDDNPEAVLVKLAGVLEKGILKAVQTQPGNPNPQVLKNLARETAELISTVVEEPQRLASQVKTMQHLLAATVKPAEFPTQQQLQSLENWLSQSTQPPSNPEDSPLASLREALLRVATSLQAAATGPAEQQRNLVPTLLLKVAQTLGLMGDKEGSAQPERLLAHLEKLARPPLFSAQIEQALKELPNLTPAEAVAKTMPPAVERLVSELQELDRQGLLPQEMTQKAPGAGQGMDSLKAFIREMAQKIPQDPVAIKGAAVLARAVETLPENHPLIQSLKDLRSYLGPDTQARSVPKELQGLLGTLVETLQMKLDAGEGRQVATDLSRLLTGLIDLASGKPAVHQKTGVMEALRPLLEHSNMLDSLSPASRSTLEHFSSLQTIDPQKIRGGDLKEMIRMLGLDTEALLAENRPEEAAQSLKSALTELSRTLPHPESEAAARVGQLVQDLQTLQYMKIRLEEQGFNIFPLPLPFLDQGYMVTDSGKEKGSSEQGDRGETLSLFLNLSGLGDLRIDLHQDPQGLSLRFQASSRGKADFLQKHRDELEKALEPHGLQSLNFTSGARSPNQELAGMMVKAETRVLDTRA